MNKTKIEWCDYTWNPIVGCTANCPYCYARRLAKRQPCQLCKLFIPHEHEERLGQPLKLRKPSRIFVGSMAEMWDPLVPLAWRRDVFFSIGMAKQHTFFALTKVPHLITFHEVDRLMGMENLWFGVSVTSHEDLWRVDVLNELQLPRAFVSFEPVLEDIDLYVWDLRGVKWVIIGGLSGDKSYAPNVEWFTKIVDEAHWMNIPVFVKDNAMKHGAPRLRQWPEEAEENV